MAEIMNFKRMTVTGVDKETAFKDVPFQVKGEATRMFQEWKNKQTGIITDADVKQFMLDYLKSKKNIIGVGYYITVTPASKSKRKCPYRFENVKRTQPTKEETTYVWSDVHTGVKVCSVNTTKAEAYTAMADEYKNGYKGDVELRKIKENVNKKAILARGFYTPSAGTCNGEYIVFGFENA